MIVDTHAHYAPQSMLDALIAGKETFSNVELLHEGDSWKLGFAGGQLTRPINPKLRFPEPRCEWMTEQGIDAQVNGGWLDSFGYELPPDEGLAWSRFLNMHLIEGAQKAGNLSPLGSVPLQDGEKAARLLEELMAKGLSGVMVGTQPYGSHGCLDAPELDPFWSAASDLGAVVFIHPMYGCGDDRLLDYDMINAVGRSLDTTTAVARMLFAGHFTKYSDMSVVLPHGGGALPWMLGRLLRNVEIHPGQYADPAIGFERLYFDTVVFDPDALRFLVAKVGAGKVMLGSDYPFPIGDHTPCEVVHKAGFDAADQTAILGDTAAKLFRLDKIRDDCCR
ncbi:MAG: amidohydrolase family protein [Pseudomonadota bacterium]|nr:amidohydrolase family protein [Pseudomonadota bacterium]